MFGIDDIIGAGLKIIDKVIPDPKQKAEAELAIIKMKQDGEFKEVEAELLASQEVTKRWQSDMMSDSWLSKNIRPLVLLFLLFVYTFFSIASGFAFTVTQAYVELLAQMLMLVMSAYFIGRSAEKISDIKTRGTINGN
jgi:hypothetical protein